MAFSIFLLPTAVWAQDGDDRELVLESFVTENHPTVDLVVSVPGELVGTDRSAVDFNVIEDGVTRPVSVVEIPSDNLSVVLVIDTSGSMDGAPVAAAREAALGFLAGMPDGTKVALVTFGSEPTLVSSFDASVEEVAGAVARIQVGGETALYEAIDLAVGQFSELEDSRNTIVLLSDGGDTVSVQTLEGASASLAETDVSYHGIELASPENDSEAMAALATAADGRVVTADDTTALSGIFDDMASYIVNQFELQYESNSNGPTELTVTAEASGAVAFFDRVVELPVAVAVAPVPATAAPVATTFAPIVEEVAALPELREGVAVEIGWFATRQALYAGLAVLFAAIAGIAFATGIGQRKTVSLAARTVSKTFGNAKGKTLSSVAEAATLFAERSLDKNERRGKVNTMLERAGVTLRPGEFMVLVAAAMLAVGAFAYLSFGAMFGIVFALFSGVLVVAWLNNKASSRSAAFGEQLPDALQLTAGSLRSGFGLLQAIETVANEVEDPAGMEFQRVKVETHLGRDTNEALKAMADRVQSEDFRWVVEAIEIHREVGGDLGDILDAVTETVRDRNRIRRRIKSLSAEGRISGVILGMLPFVLAAVVMFINPDYLSELFISGIGKAMVAGGLVAMFVGFFWMRRLTTLEY